MKLGLFNIVFLVSSISLFNVTYKYNHYHTILTSIPKTTFTTCVYVDDETGRPFFNKRKVEHVVDGYFKANILNLYVYDYTLTFLNLDNVIKNHDYVNAFVLSFDASLFFNYSYHNQVTISLINQYA